MKKSPFKPIDDEPDINFVREFMNYCELVVDCPKQYHYTAALAILSSIIGRRVGLKHVVSHPIYPNLWFLLLGRSGISRKTTIMKFARDFIPHVDNKENYSTHGGTIYKLPDSWTIEALFEIAKEHDKGKKNYTYYWERDEFASWLAKGKKEANTSTKDDLRSIYDNGTLSKGTRTHGIESTKGFVLTILAGSTPGEVGRHLSLSQEIENGLLSRFCMVPSTNYKVRGFEETKRDIEIETLLKNKILHINTNAIALSGAVVESKDVVKVFNDLLMENMEKAEKKPEFSGIYQRMSVNAVKIALLYALQEKDNKPKGNNIKVREYHAEEAVGDVRKALQPWFFQSIDFINSSHSNQFIERNTHEEDKIIQCIKRIGKKIIDSSENMGDREFFISKHSDTMRDVKFGDYKLFKDRIESLRQSDNIRILVPKPKGDQKKRRPGRKALYYMVPNNHGDIFPHIVDGYVPYEVDE
ncbi:MAG: DUF3987 domain-containing protein [Candidatus Hodarchaeales archaeon]